jgi:hypothetical protein
MSVPLQRIDCLKLILDTPKGKHMAAILSIKELGGLSRVHSRAWGLCGKEDRGWNHN